MANSINTNISAYYAQLNIGIASAATQGSVSRLSSGNRIVKASDDVAALSTGTSLRTQVTALKTALTNASQGTSLLQVADGALSQVGEILQRQKAIALQAGSGSLTDSDRNFLNIEFQELSAEIDRLTGSANFNGVKLINGSLSQAAKVSASTDKATAASGTLALSSNLVAGESVIINGVRLDAVTSLSTTPATARGQFLIGTTTADTIKNLADKLNALSQDANSVALVSSINSSGTSTLSGVTTTNAAALGGASYKATSTTLEITSRVGGSAGNSFTVKLGDNVASGKVSVSGQYGGATINLLATNFTSATAAITSGTASQAAAIPFKAGDTIKATIGSSSAVSLYTLQADDSLTDIVAGINANSATSGFKAVLTNPAAGEYNIQLQTASSSGNVALNGGDNYFTTAATGAQTYAISGATSTINLLSSSFATASAGGAIVGASASASTPFVDGSELYISIAGGAKVSIATLATGDTVASLVTKINNSATAGALGIIAALSESNNNIAITYSDSARVGTGTSTAVTFSSGLNTTTNNVYNTDALGKSNSVLNGAYLSFNLFASGFNAPDTDIVSSNGSGTASAPLETGTDLAIAFNSSATAIGTAIELIDGASIGATDTLQDIAGKINASPGAIANGIHASVVLDDAGKYNIQLRYQTSGSLITGTGGTASTTGVRLTYDNSTVGGTSQYEPTPLVKSDIAETQYTSYRLFTSAFAATLSAGQAVAAATATEATPFDSDASLSIRILGHNSNNAVDLLGTGGFAVGDTLQDVVNRINANTTGGDAHGFSAVLDGNGTNILVRYQGTAAVNGRASFTAGAGSHGTVTAGLNNSYSTGINLFGTDIATGSAAGAFVITNGTPASNTPLDDTGTLTIGGLSAFSLGATTTLQDIVDYVNEDPAAAAAGLSAVLVNTGGNNYNIRLLTSDVTNTGAVASSITVSASSAPHANLTTTITQTLTTVDNILTNVRTAAASSDNGATGLTNLSSFGLAGGKDNGLGYGSTTVSGAIGDDILTGLAQNKARSLINFPDIDPAALTATGNFGTAGAVKITLGGQDFFFVTAATAENEITIGATLRETLDNAVSTINSYAKNNATGDTAYQLNQLNVSRNGNSIVIEGKGISNVTNIAGGNSTVALTNFTNGATVSSANLSNSSRNGSSTFGVDVSGISNADFVGKIGGFEATYVSPNTVNLSVKVGAYTYTANNVNTNPIDGNKVIRFISDDVGSGATASNGGYFDIQLQNNKGFTANSSVDADTFASHINAAFNGLEFAQSRKITSYSGTESITSGSTVIGSLLGSSVSAKLDSFAANKLTNIVVAAPETSGADAKITLTIDGKQYASSGLGSQLGANQTYRFVNTTDSGQYIEFTTGATDIDLSTTANAKAVQTALANAFGVSNGAGALSFQIGSAADDTLAVSIGNATTDSLFDGKALSVSTQSNAEAASAQLDIALQNITTIRAQVGALQSRFNFASANIQISVQNQDAARGDLLDTDVAAESTSYATAQVKLQAGISVLAQANQSLQNLLKLIQ